MRVAVVSFSDIPSDPRVRRQVETFSAVGWQVDVFGIGTRMRLPGVKHAIAPLRRRRAGTFRYLFEYAAFWILTFGWVVARVTRGRPDVVYVNSPPDALSLAAWPARLRRVPVVLDVHDPMPELFAAKGRSGALARLLGLQERWGIRFADVVITVHEPLRELLISRNPEVDPVVVMNVPDTAGVSKIDLDPDSREVVFAGTVAYRYGLDDLVEAMASISDEIPGLRLKVIGEGEDRERLAKLADDRGVVVEFTGRLSWPEVQSAQRRAWVGVNVPKPDLLGELSFSNKIVEWVAMGIPVIAGRTSTLLRYFPDETLVYVEPGSPASIAEGLRRVDREDVGPRLVAAAKALDSISWTRQREVLLETIAIAGQSVQA